MGERQAKSVGSVHSAAAKAFSLCRVFAKPFLVALPHRDGVNCLARNPQSLSCLVWATCCGSSAPEEVTGLSATASAQVAGCADGVVKVWDVPGRRPLRSYEEHTGGHKLLHLLDTYTRPGWQLTVVGPCSCGARRVRNPAGHLLPVSKHRLQRQAVADPPGTFAVRACSSRWRDSCSLPGEERLLGGGLSLEQRHVRDLGGTGAGPAPLRLQDPA